MSHDRNRSLHTARQEHQGGHPREELYSGDVGTHQDTVGQAGREDSASGFTSHRQCSEDAATHAASGTRTMERAPLLTGDKEVLSPGAEAVNRPVFHQPLADRAELIPSSDEDIKPRLLRSNCAAILATAEPRSDRQHEDDTAQCFSSDGVTQCKSYTPQATVAPEQHTTASAPSTLASSSFMPFLQAEDKELRPPVASPGPQSVSLVFPAQPMQQCQVSSRNIALSPALPTFPICPLPTHNSDVSASSSMMASAASPYGYPTPPEAPFSRFSNVPSATVATPVQGPPTEQMSPAVPSKVDMSATNGGTAVNWRTPGRRRGPENMTPPSGVLACSGVTRRYPPASSVMMKEPRDGVDERGIERHSLEAPVGTTTIREFTQITASLIDANPHVCSLVCGLTLFFTTVATMLILISRRGVRTQVEECRSAACIRAAESLNSLMDNTVHPCHDFHAHVCRRWEARGRLSYLDESVQQIARRVSRSLLNANQLMLFTRRNRLVASFYRLCVSFMAEPGGQDFSAGVLLPLVSFYRDILALDRYSAVIARLLGLSLRQRIHTVFGVKLLRHGSAVYLRIFPGKTLAQKVHPYSAVSFDQYLQMFVTVVAQSTGGALSFDLENLLSIEQDVQRILMVNTTDGTRKQDIKLANLSILSDQLASLDWLEAVNGHLLTNQKLTIESGVIIDDFGSVRSILEQFGRLRAHGVSYLYVNALLDAMRFDYLRAILNKTEEDVMHVCLQASAEAMWSTRRVIVDLIFGDRSTESGRDVTSDIFRSVQQTLTGSHSGLRWMGTAMRHYANRTLSAMSLHLDGKGDFDNALPHTGHVTEDIFAVKRLAEFPAVYMHLRAEEQQQFLAYPNAKDHGDDFHFFEKSPSYDAEGNTMIVPASLRLEPLHYTSEVPLEFTAGSLGVLIAKEIYQAVLFSRAPSTWGKREEIVLKRFDQCSRLLAVKALNVSVESLEQDQQSRQKKLSPHIGWMMAARTAYEALRLALQGFPTGTRWARYWKEAQRTFFRRFCLLTCGHHASVAEGVEDGALSSRSFCLLSIANMPDFSKAFDCEGYGQLEEICLLE